jgi:hypothetical protein
MGAIGSGIAATLIVGSWGAFAAGSTSTSASALLNHACKDTVAATAFRVQGHVADGGKRLGVVIHFGSAGAILAVTRNGNQTVNLIVNGPSTYMKADRAFWGSVVKNPAAASLLAGRWFDVTSDKRDFAGLTRQLSKGSLFSKACVRGRATYVGHASVNGVKVIRIHETSSDESDTYSIENGATPLILSVTGSSSPAKGSGDLVFSEFGVQPDTSAPQGTIPISAFG